MKQRTKLGAVAAAVLALACGQCGERPQQPKAGERDGTTSAGTPTGTVNTGEAGKGSQGGRAQGSGDSGDPSSGTTR
jgi:hypothetical protein